MASIVRIFEGKIYKKKGMTPDFHSSVLKEILKYPLKDKVTPSLMSFKLQISLANCYISFTLIGLYVH